MSLETSAPVVVAIEALLSSPAPASESEGESCLILGAACKALGWAWTSEAAFARAAGVAALEPLVAQFAALPMSLADAWYALGVVFRSLEALEAARSAFEQAVAAGPDKAEAHNDLAMTLLALGEPEAAQRSLERVLDLRPGAPETLAQLSLVLQGLGRLDEAADLARQALEANPDLKLAHRSLSALYAAQGDEAKSKAHRDRAFGGANLVVLPALRAKSRVLILSTSGSGNTPDRHLIPVTHYTRLLWIIEYATEAQIAELPPFDVVFNGISDPDLARATAEAVDRFVALCPRRVLNPPSRVAMTARDRLPAFLDGLDDVVTPRTVRIAAGARSIRRDGFDGAVLLRPAGTHGGQGLQRLESVDALRGVPAGDHYLTAFHDFRSADGLYRKYRMIFVDGRPYPYHLAISDQWMVHRYTADMDTRPACLMEEAFFLRDPEAAIGLKALNVTAQIAARIGLDFCGLDFSVLPDGRVLVFEANAAMHVHPEKPDGPLAHKNPYIERILAAFQRLLTPQRRAADQAGALVMAGDER